MPRGKKAELGDTKVSQNGYHYTKTGGGWVLTHRIVMEKHIGRLLESDERVTFADGDRTNFRDPENLILSKIKEKSKASRRARLESRIEDLQAELELIDE